MTASSLLIVLLASLATVGLGVYLLRILGFKNLPPTLLLGVGYGLGVVAAAKLLHLASTVGVALDIAGWILVSLGLVAAGEAIRQRFFLRSNTRSGSRQLDHRKLSGPFGAWNVDPLIAALVLLLAAHLAITLSNNLLRPIFPWDAFTTWMYRAKAWALQNSITPMASVDDWIAAGGQSGYALYASHYPTALSIYTAFVAALVGGWQPAAASLPWSLCLLALCMSAHGLLVLAGISNRLALIGAYLLGSMPLLNIHAALAGYGDLWMALYSGSGLAALLIWRMSGRTAAVWLALLLLIAGTQIKTEGWLWLGLGLGFMALEWVASRIGYLKLLASLLVVTGVIWGLGITSLTLGPLGQWGFDETHLHAGALGSYALRPYNPAGSYWSILFEQGNFLLLASFYLLALLLISIKRRHNLASLWVMGLLIAGFQLVIFGLSAYSLYAETGTAITRVLLHFMPVAIVSIILSWSGIQEKIGVKANQNLQPDRREVSTFFWPRVAASSALIVAALIAPLGLLAIQPPPSFQATSEQMIAVVGETKNTNLGRQFIDSPINVGVLKAPGTPPLRPTRYLRADVTIATAESASFYWINEGETQVNSTPITLSGESLIDLNRFAAWRTGDKREFGFLIQTSDFGRTYFRDFSLSNDIGIASFPAIVNQWRAGETLTQKSINNTLGHHESPASVITWVTGSVALVVTLFTVLCIAKKIALLNLAGGPTLLGLWLIAGNMTLNTTPMGDCLSQDTICLSSAGKDPQAAEIIYLAKEIEAHVPPPAPILIISDGDPLIAEKLPFALLPRRVVDIKGFDWRLAESWQGAWVLSAEDESKLNKLSERLISQLKSPPKAIQIGNFRLYFSEN